MVFWTTYIVKGTNKISKDGQYCGFHDVDVLKIMWKAIIN